MITNMTTNLLGTLSFDGKFPGMRKAQDFCTMPIKEMVDDCIVIQSDTRIGRINLLTGWVSLSKPHSSGAYFSHLREAIPVVKLTAEELFMLKAHIMGTASSKVGTNGIVYCDNSGASEVFK